MTISVIDPGNSRLLRAVFTEDDSGDGIDPDDVFLVIQTPDGTETEYEYGVDGEIENPSVGTYTAEIVFPTSGLWTYRWYSTGLGVASAENHIKVSYTKIV